MIRRILVFTGMGLALAAGARLVWGELAEHAWEQRRDELLELALFPSSLRRPWEVRYEALQERLLADPRFDEIVGSPYRPQVAWGGGEPRRLDDFERVWVESMWGELLGLDGLLAELHRLPLEELEWNGKPVKLRVLRECVNALCARAWQAVEHGDDAEAARGYGDALRLTQATDDGSSWGLMTRMACARIALDSARSALDLGLSPRELRAALAPLLEGWSYSAEGAERRIRRDLAALADFDPLRGGSWYDAPRLHRWAVDWLAPVEEALELARGPASATPLDKVVDSSPLQQWTLAARILHALHAQRNVALSALAVAAYREEHGAWPSALDRIPDLSSEQTLDTLSGEPLAYWPDESWARIGPATWSEREDEWQGPGESPYAWTLHARSFP